LPTVASGCCKRLQTYVWYPERRDQTTYPLFIFSHGYGPDPRIYSELLRHLASQGFVVGAPAHDDCATSPCVRPLFTSDPTTPEQAARRLEDVAAVLDNMLALSAGQGSVWSGLIDANRIGLGGQSFGGWTTLAMGARDARFRAMLALNPALTIGMPSDPNAVAKPLMLMAGELDTMSRLFTLKGFYSRIPPTAPDRVRVVVPNAGHEFMDRCGPSMVVVWHRPVRARVQPG